VLSLFVSQKYSIKLCNIQSQLQWSDIICQQLFLLSHSARRTEVISVSTPILHIVMTHLTLLGTFVVTHAMLQCLTN